MKKGMIFYIINTYIVLIIIFLHGLFTYKCDLICLPLFSAALEVIVFFPIVTIIGSIIVKKNVHSKLKNPVLVYIGSTLGVVILFVIISIMIYKINFIIETNRHNQKTNENTKLINNTIADEIHKVYPNAEISMLYSTNITSVSLKGYSYTKQPNFDEEKSKLEQLKMSKAISEYPYRINVDYYFEDEQKPFATIRMQDLYLFYSSLGMSKEGIKIVNNQIKEYLYSYNIDCNFEDTGYFGYTKSIVNIHKRLSEEDKIQHDILWKNFVNTYDINTDLVNITVYYQDPKNAYNVIYYEVGWEDPWYGEYKNDNLNKVD